MNDDVRRRLKVARERLADMEEDLAHIERRPVGNSKAASERDRLRAAIADQKRVINELEGQLSGGTT